MSTTTPNDSSQHSTNQVFSSDALNDVFEIEVPKQASPKPEALVYSAQCIRKHSVLSGQTTRGCSPRVEEKKSRLNAKSPHFGVSSPETVSHKSSTQVFPSNFPTWVDPLDFTVHSHPLALLFPSEGSRTRSEGNQCHLASSRRPLTLFDAVFNSDDCGTSTNLCPPPSGFEVKFKTEMCRNFEMTGHCKFGNQCSFAHGELELRSKTHINPHYKSKRCSQYFDHGFCPYGSRCQYLHKDDSYAHVFQAYCDKLAVWINRNPQLDIGTILRKTHPLIKRLSVFEKSELEEQKARRSSDSKDNRD